MLRPYSVQHHRPDRLALMHQIKRLIDPLQRHRMRDQIIDIDTPFHVPVHNRRHVGTAARAAKGTAAPYTASHQLERTCGDFLTGTGHTDDDGFTPTLVTGFQRLTHGVDVADTFKGVIRATLGQLNNGFNHIGYFFGVDKISHTKLACQLYLARVDVHPHDLTRADHTCRLYYIKADATQSEHYNA